VDDRRRWDDRGNAYVEYAFLVVLIAVVCLVAVGVFGEATSKKYEDPQLSAVLTS
jgi:Flp pilus assembly pilin Flp